MDAVDPNATAVTAANATATATDAASPPMQLNVVYTVFEVLVAVAAVVGNALVMLVFHRERRLRRRTNYYIVSLAAADFLVGLLGIPFAILASVGLPRDLHACLFTVSLLVVLCTISIFCLVAVSVDRYWAILHPMGYSRNVRTKTAIESFFDRMATIFRAYSSGWGLGEDQTSPSHFEMLINVKLFCNLLISSRWSKINILLKHAVKN